MCTRIFTVISLLLIFYTSSLSAQNTTRDITDKFFQLYTEDPGKAIDYGFSTNKWVMEKNMAAVENVRLKLLNLINLIGDYRGYEMVNEKTIGESLKLQSYMMKYDRQPIRFTFIFYRPSDSWVVQNFQYDANLTDELEELGRIAPLPKE
ncbi:MAG: hypothetical protein R8P61_00340 [Bacteroidia bacterium]|nr:hypothetical protein [Bacteroidia bacterium]